jgi:hypothetical protein
MAAKPQEITHPLVKMTAHRNRAKNVGGTTIPLIQKRMRSLEIGMRASAVWRNQYRNKQSKPAAARLSVTRKYILRRM